MLHLLIPSSKPWQPLTFYALCSFAFCKVTTYYVEFSHRLLSLGNTHVFSQLYSLFFFSFFIKCLFYTGIYLIYNIVLVSAVQKSDSVIHMDISIPSQVLFLCGSLENIEQSSLCYTIGSYRLSMLYLVVYIC